MEAAAIAIAIAIAIVLGDPAASSRCKPRRIPFVVRARDPGDRTRGRCSLTDCWRIAPMPPLSAPSKSLRWPSLYEAISLLVAFGALSVSFASFWVTRETENAQDESLSVKCQYKKFVSLDLTKAEFPNAITFAWTATISNNSRTPVTYNRVYLDDSSNDRSVGSSAVMLTSSNKYGADHSLFDTGVFIDARKRITVGFDYKTEISPKAASVDGLAKANTLEAIEGLVGSHGIDIFGNPLERHNVGQGRVINISVGTPHLTLFVETDSGRSFPGDCFINDGWSSY